MGDGVFIPKKFKALRYVEDHVDELEAYDHNDHVTNWELQLDRDGEFVDSPLIIDPVLKELVPKLESVIKQMVYKKVGDWYYAKDHNLFADAWNLQFDINKRIAEKILPPDVSFYISCALSDKPYSLRTDKLVSDPYSKAVLKLDFESEVFVICNLSKRHGTRADPHGFWALLNVDGEDKTETKTFCDMPDYDLSCSCTLTWFGILPEGSHTFEARFMHNYPDRLVRLDSRQMLIIAKPVASRGYIGGRQEYKRTTMIGTEFIDDPHSEFKFTLPEFMKCFLVYNTGTEHVIEGVMGHKTMLNIDGKDIDLSRSEKWGNRRNVKSFGYKLLFEGDHILRGRYCAVQPDKTIAMDVRQIGVIGLTDEVDIKHREMEFKKQTSETTPIDDIGASIDLDLAEDSVVLTFYNATTYWKQINYYLGKYTLINIDGEDIPETRSDSCTSVSSWSDALLSLWGGLLRAGAHTLTGRFASNVSGQTVSVDLRTFSLIIIPYKYIARYYSRVE